MKHSKFYSWIPMIIWISVAWAFLIIRSGFQVYNIHDEPNTRISYSEIHDGQNFTATHTNTTQQWVWQYTAMGQNGCEQILFNDISPVTVVDDTIVIHLKTFIPSTVCVLPAREVGVSGRIVANAESRFKVIVDGKDIFPSPK